LIIGETVKGDEYFSGCSFAGSQDAFLLITINLGSSSQNQSIFKVSKKKKKTEENKRMHA